MAESENSDMSVKRLAYLTALNLASLVPKGRRYFRRYLPDMQMQVAGRLFDLHPRDNYVDYKIFAYNKLYEGDSLRHLQALVKGRRCLMYDVGMNIGLYTVVLAPEMAPGSRVAGFEPNPVLHPRIESNLRLNGIDGMVDLHRVAVGEAPGTARLSVNGQDFGASTLHTSLSRNLSRVIDVPVICLADLAQDWDAYDLFVIKIDVEGYEDAALMPLFEHDVARLPDLLLLEIVHERKWQKPLLATLADHGYEAIFKGDGNVLYQRKAKS